MASRIQIQFPAENHWFSQQPYSIIHKRVEGKSTTDSFPVNLILWSLIYYSYEVKGNMLKSR